MLVFHIIKTNLTKRANFSEIYYHISFQDPELSTVNVAPPSYVHASTMLLLTVMIYIMLGCPPTA
jgi:hypothetical protein